MDPRECQIMWERRYLCRGMQFGGLSSDFATLPLPEPRRPRVFRTAILPARHPDVRIAGDGRPDMVHRGRPVDLKTGGKDKV